MKIPQASAVSGLGTDLKTGVMGARYEYEGR